MCYRTITVILLNCAVAIAEVAAGARPEPSPTFNGLCFVDGLKYSTIQSAISACAGTGMVVIPPTYAGTESSGNPEGIAVWDFRHSERPKGLTPVTDFGAKGDAETANDGASQIGVAAFASASASFAPGRDEGKAIVITGAGPDNASLTTVIKSVLNPHRVALAAAGSFTGTHLTYWLGTDNTSAFQAAYRSQKPLFLPPGKYLMTGTVKGSTPLFLSGSGAESVIINDGAVFNLHGGAGHFVDNFRMQPATKLTPVSPRGFPTPHAGTPVTLDRIGAGIGYQPEPQDGDVWPKVSKQQQAQQIGPIIQISADDIHIYRITGDRISILLFDVQFSEVALCDFTGGKNFVGGIVLWHTPRDGRMNKQDSIHDNHVSYASFNGIIWAASQKVSIRRNVTEYNGESGFKNYGSQGDGTYNTEAEVIGNHTQHNHYDGFDLSQDYPHANAHRASSVASGNTSNFNDRTGTYADGLGWKLTDNVFEGNGLSGMSLDVSESVISGNTLTRNNALRDRNSHQMLIGPGKPSQNNVIEHNSIVGPATSGAAIKLSAASIGNKLHNNTASGGAVFEFAAPPVESRGNSDSRGRYAER